jgi:lactoylglutathione lyase
MNEIHGIYEIAIPVTNLERAEAFYIGILGLESGLREEGRRWHFLRAGGQRGMIVLQENQDAWAPTHFAFTTTDADIETAAEALRDRGIDVSGPVTHDWMPARSIYFNDPDGHALELCAPLGA